MECLCGWACERQEKRNAADDKGAAHPATVAVVSGLMLKMPAGTVVGVKHRHKRGTSDSLLQNISAPRWATYDIQFSYSAIDMQHY